MLTVGFGLGLVWIKDRQPDIENEVIVRVGLKVLNIQLCKVFGLWSDTVIDVESIRRIRGIKDLKS